jgi:hypothetical protein
MFTAAALAGPLVAWTSLAMTNSAPHAFFYDLALLLWPTQVLAIMEVSIGRLFATVLAVVANVGVFLAIGAVQCRVRKSRPALIALSALVIAGIISVAAWSSGYSLQHFNFLAALVASTFILALIWVPAIRAQRRIS